MKKSWRLWRVAIVSLLLTVLMIVPDTALAANQRVVAIATLLNHPTLAAIQAGMKQELTREGYIEGKNIKYIVMNANGQIQLAPAIAREIAIRRPDVTVAITTPIAQAVAKVVDGPIVFAAVTDPVGAGLLKSLDKPPPNITGTSDAWPYQDQLQLIHDITPSVRRLGILYNPGEPSSQYGMRQLRRLAPRMGFKIVDGPVNSPIDVYPVAESLSRRVDALFLSSDNTAIAGMAGALKVAVEHKIPYYVGDSGSVEKGGLAAVSVGYFQLGVETGKRVVRMLRGERSIPVYVARGSEIYVNTASAKLMGVSIPRSVLQRATRVYNKIVGH